jgi:two-component system, OmpR family, sensor histidine kinase MprB
VIRPRDPGLALPPGAAARAVAAGEHEPFFADVDLGGAHLRVYTAQVEPGQAVQIARSLDDVDDTLARLALILALVSVGSVALAAGLGVVVSRAALTPVARLSRAAREVAATRDLSRRIDPGAGGELAELARSFNSMLTALDDSLSAQRRLVADASHELRTPLASLRTNIEVLAHSGEMPESQREGLLADVIAQLDELTVLVGDVVDLARGTEPSAEPPVALRLDLLTADAVERARSRAHTVAIRLDATPCTVHGIERRLDRALANLLDNAIKWSPPGGVVEVTVRSGSVEVRDHGPGISPADLPHVFDRFYRSAAARGMPGSGLGLAIVRQVAEAHGGTVSAAPAPGGGTLLALRLPVIEPPTADRDERAPGRAGALT